MSVLFFISVFLTSFIISTEDESSSEYQIVHANNFNGEYYPTLSKTGYEVGGLPRFSGFVRDSVFIQAGNIIRKSVSTNRPTKFHADLKILERLKATITVLGESEFHLLPENYDKMIDEVHPEISCVNADIPATTKYKAIPDTNIIVMGYIPRSCEDHLLASMQNLQVIDPIQALTNQIQQMNGTYVFVAAGCAGIDFAKRIAVEVEGIDMVISGCSRHMQWNNEDVPENIPKYSNYPLTVSGIGGKRVLVAHTYGSTKFVGNLTIRVDESGNIVHHQGEMIYLDQHYPEDPIMAEIVNKVKLVELARTRVFLNGNCFNRECNLGNLITDSFVSYKVRNYNGEHWTDTSIGLLPSKNIKGSINTNLTENMVVIDNVLYLFQPHHRLITAKLSGRDLLKLFETTIEQRNEYRGIFLQASGVRIYYDENKPQRNRFVRFLVTCSQCNIPKFQTINLRENYQVITTTDMLENVYGMNIFASAAQQVTKENMTDYHALKEYLITRNLVNVIRDERTRIIKKSISTRVVPPVKILAVIIMTTTFTILVNC